MSDAPERSQLGLVALAAWINCRPDQIPENNKAHTCEATMKAWGRVEDAVRAELEAQHRAELEAVRAACARVAQMWPSANYADANTADMIRALDLDEILKANRGD